MNVYHIKLTDNQKAALEHLFSLDITWNKTELETAWNELREQVREAAQHVAIINALQDSGCNCKKPTDNATKYAPCCKFRKGNTVKASTRDGRAPYGRLRNGGKIKLDEERLYIVTRDEDKNDVLLDPLFDVRAIASTNIIVDVCYLELVAPAKEPYSVHESEVVNSFDIVREKMCVMTFPFGSKEEGYYRNKLAAKEAAVAECERLNEKWRKELEK